jgi:hypothetical protein
MQRKVPAIKLDTICYQFTVARKVRSCVSADFKPLEIGSCMSGTIIDKDTDFSRRSMSDRELEVTRAQRLYLYDQKMEYKPTHDPILRLPV